MTVNTKKCGKRIKKNDKVIVEQDAIVKTRNAVKQSAALEEQNNIPFPYVKQKANGVWHLAEYWESQTNVRVKCGRYIYPISQTQDSVNPCLRCLKALEA
jgi:hypothetical protein